MPRYLLQIIEDEKPYLDMEPEQTRDVLVMHQDFAAAVTAAGASVLGGEALQPSSTASYLRNTRTEQVSAVDNPSPDVKEVLGGYYLIEAKDDAQAVELARACPAPFGYVEVRPIWEFGAPE